MSRRTAPRTVLSDGLLNAALMGAGLLLLVLLYGFASRALLPRTSPDRAEPVAVVSGNARIKVEVRNAAGLDRLARDAGAFLRRRGFDVVQTGNAPPADTSRVVLRAGSAADARHVAASLRLPETALDLRGDPNDYQLDITVYLGADYPARAPFDTPQR
jgi:hypothetical protein